MKKITLRLDSDTDIALTRMWKGRNALLEHNGGKVVSLNRFLNDLLRVYYRSGDGELLTELYERAVRPVEKGKGKEKEVDVKKPAERVWEDFS